MFLGCPVDSKIDKDTHITYNMLMNEKYSPLLGLAEPSTVAPDAHSANVSFPDKKRKVAIKAGAIVSGVGLVVAGFLLPSHNPGESSNDTYKAVTYDTSKLPRETGIIVEQGDTPEGIARVVGGTRFDELPRDEQIGIEVDIQRQGTAEYPGGIGSAVGGHMIKPGDVISAPYDPSSAK